MNQACENCSNWKRDKWSKHYGMCSALKRETQYNSICLSYTPKGGVAK